MKTKYRLVDNGWVNFLEYEKTYTTFFGLFTRTKWVKVWRPYYDYAWGREERSATDLKVCGYNTNLKNFVKEWPDINDYFEWAAKEQYKLEQEVRKEKRERKKRENSVTYL